MKAYTFTSVSVYEGEEIIYTQLFSTKAKALKKYAEEKKAIRYDFKEMNVEYTEDEENLAYCIYETGYFANNHFTMKIEQLEIE